jgi:hypothetical protein
MRPRQTVLFLVAALIFGGLLSAEAMLYLHSGQYSFQVDVRNSHFKDISRASGYASVSGNSARIQVEAPGYRQGWTNVYLSPNQTSYRADVRLDDPFVNADVRDASYKPVPNSSIQTYLQSMYWGDEYGIRGYLPKEGFQQLTERRIEVQVNSMYAFAPRVYLSPSGDRWNFEIVIRRQDMNSYSNQIRILVPRDEPQAMLALAEDLSALAADYRCNAGLLQTLTGEEFDVVQSRLNSLARRMRTAFPTLTADAQADVLRDMADQAHLAAELKAIQVFQSLHR